MERTHQKFNYPDLLANVPMLTKGPSDEAIRAHGNAVYGDKLTIDERAAIWIAENPEPCRLFEKFALEAIAAGRAKIGAKALAEHVRWDSWVKGTDYRMNNDAVALLARRFMQKYPQHGKVFETRGNK